MQPPDDQRAPFESGRIGHGRIAVVTPRYGPEVVGGSETLMRELAHGLADRGWDVEVLTSCAQDHFSWRDVFPPGTSRVDNLTVRRFPASVSKSRHERVFYNRAINAGSALRLDEQYRWLNDDVRMPEMFHHLVDHGDEYRAVLLSPYLFWPTVACAEAVPERSILIPCLHDEPEAYLGLFDALFSSVRGIWFLSDPEARLAERLHPGLAEHRVLGTGVHVPTAYDAQRFRKKYGIEGRFVLYAGRREAGKNWDDLLDGFAAACVRSALPFSLALPVRAPAAIADRVIDLGYVPTEDRDDAFAAADAYLQPSRYESFSRTMMESWLAETLVIANGGSEVNRWHCDRSGAGLVYDDALELEQCLRFVADSPAAAAAIGASGRGYVLDNYTWGPVLDRVEECLGEWLPPGGSA